MKLEVGQFVRFKDKRGIEYIRKIVEIPEDNRYASLYLDKDVNYSKGLSVKNVIKASYNIIDILEEGDYVNGYYVSKIWEKDEITHYVDETPIKRKQREIVIQAPSYGGIEILKNNNIKTIVTKEQFEQMSYKIGE